jgi:hypothetical protein
MVLLSLGDHGEERQASIHEVLVHGLTNINKRVHGMTISVFLQRVMSVGFHVTIRSAL